MMILIGIALLLLAGATWIGFLWNYDELESLVPNDLGRLFLVATMVLVGLVIGVGLTQLSYPISAETTITGFPLPVLVQDQFGTSWGAVSLIAWIANPLFGAVLVLAPGALRNYSRARKKHRENAV